MEMRAELLSTGGETLSDPRNRPRLDGPPSVWVVTGYRAGERSQVLALADALGWPFEVKELAYRKQELLTSLLRGTGLRGIRREQSSSLEPPWPDLVISAGMRNEPVCRWIRAQAGGRTRIVHIGRPWAGLDRFDLVVTTPQYQLPEHPNVLHNLTTLQSVTERRLAEESARWAPRVKGLTSPYITVVVGGDSGPYTFGPKAARRLAQQASAQAREQGGSLLVTSSARTSAAAMATLKANISVPFELYEWSPGGRDNPYYGYLALAQSIIVTGDSIAMLSEASATRKPVYIFDPGEGELSMRTPTAHRWWRSAFAGTGDGRLSGLLYLLLMRLGPRFRSRDIRLVHRGLISAGRAVWLGEAFPAEVVFPPLCDVERAVTRVRGLFA